LLYINTQVKKESSMEKTRKQIGDVLVELGLLDEQKLKTALETQQKEGLKLGEALIRLGYLSEDQVLGILSNLTGIPTLDMRNETITKEAQLLIPQDRMKELMAIPIAVEGPVMKVAMSDPLNLVLVENVKFILNRDIKVILASQSQIEDILSTLNSIGYGKMNLHLKNVDRNPNIINIITIDTTSIFKLLNEPDTTDLHVTIGASPAIRKNAIFTRTSLPAVTPDLMDKIIKEVTSEEYIEELKEKKEVEFTYIKRGVGRYRINIFFHRDGEPSINAHKLIEDIPNYKSQGFPDFLMSSLTSQTGLFIVSSPGGQEKNRAIATVIDYINTNRSCNIVTFEDPIEYLHEHKLANVIQREIGRDTTKNTSKLFEDVFKYDPDILVFSMITDSLMAKTALQATQKGILVIAGMLGLDVFSTTDQYLSLLSDEYMKSLFSHSLMGVFSMKRIGAKEKKGGAFIWELLLGKARVQKFIRENKIHFIKGQAQSLQGEYFPMEESLANVIKSGKIDLKTIEEEPGINKDLLNSYLARR
jgi:twitching motility protein PilT